MSELLKNYLGGRWVEGNGQAALLMNPVTGDELVRASTGALDLKAAYQFARETGGAALRAMTYAQRAAALARLVEVFKANRDKYLDITIQNSGTTKADASPDVDGAIFTLGYYAKLGAGLGEARFLTDGAATPLDKAGAFKSQHVTVPSRGLVLCINAFNFPAWGLWEKAAPALLAGVPVVAKPATATSWLTHQMISDALAANVLPPGALSLICGSTEGVLEPLTGMDLVSFTGSAETAAMLRTNAAITSRSVRMNVEADSLNSMYLDMSVTPSSAHFTQFVGDAVKELCVKSGQRCTAPRRLFVHKATFDAAREALTSKLSGVTVGNPRSEGVRMGSLVSATQKKVVLRDLAKLASEADVAFDGAKVKLVDAAEYSACLAPTLLAARTGSQAIHEVEVFGPVMTLIRYEDQGDAAEQIRRGGGSLVSSVYAEDPAMAASFALSLADSHGRVHVVTPAVAAGHTGHGNVMPASIHGGPGRAGGGEELGGLRALNFYHRRTAIQAEAAAIATLESAPRNA